MQNVKGWLYIDDYNIIANLRIILYHFYNALLPLMCVYVKR